MSKKELKVVIAIAIAQKVLVGDASTYPRQRKAEKSISRNYLLVTLIN